MGIRWYHHALSTSAALDFRDLAFVICLSERKQTLRLIKTLEKPGSVKDLEIPPEYSEPQSLDYSQLSAVGELVITTFFLVWGFCVCHSLVTWKLILKVFKM